MKTYKIEIQEFLSRVVEVEATDLGDAFCMINKQYNKAEIVLDYNDFVEVNFIDIESQSPKDEKEKLIDEIVDYLYENEKRHFEEYEVKPIDHIFNKLIRLKELNKIN